jgi:hypothetical protein
MKNKKKKNLKSKGYSIGSAEDFLELDKEESQFIKKKLRKSISINSIERTSSG